MATVVPSENLSKSSLVLLQGSRHLGVLTASLEKIMEANDAFLNMVRFSREEMEAGLINWAAIAAYLRRVMKRALILIAFTGGIWCSQAYAVGIPRFEVKELANSADLIVIADVTAIRKVGPARPIPFRGVLLPASAYSADLSVRRTLKGHVLGGINVTYALPETFIGYSGLRSGIRMVFLRRDNGQYHLADPYYSNLPATSEPPGGGMPSEISEVVLSNMLEVLASPVASSSEKREILRVDYSFSSNAKTIAALRKGLSASSDQALIEKIQGELVRFGDLSQLPDVANLLCKDLATQDGRVWLLYVIREYVKDPRAIPAINPLLGSPDDVVREAAVEALWHMNSPAAVPFLLKKLEDPDEMVQFYAVRGLADIENEYGWGGPSEAEFHEHAQKYLAHWEEWAKERSQ